MSVMEEPAFHREEPIATSVRTGVEGAEVVVWALQPAIVRWVERCMTPWWPVGPVTEGNRPPAVRARVDPSAVRGVAETVHNDPEPVSLYLSASGLRRRVGDRTYVWSPARQLAYEYDAVRRCVHVMGEAVAEVQKETARLTRVLVTNALESAGWTVLHAGCVTGPGGTVLVPGVKGAGKTTTSILAAELPGHRLIAHDLCLVRATEDSVRVVAIPTPLRIGLGLVAALGWGPALTAAVRQGVPLHPFLDRRVEAALREGRYERLDDGGRELKVELFPREMASLFGIPTATTAAVSAVLVPQPVPGEAAHVDPVEEFSRHVIWGPTSGYPDFLGMGAPPRPLERPQTRVLLDRLAALPRRQLALEFDIDRDRRLIATALAARVSGREEGDPA